MVKKYQSGSSIYNRIISKPVIGTCIFQRGGIALSIGTSPGEIDFDATTGRISFVADAEDDIASITTGATTQVTLSSNPGGLISGQLLYLDGLEGSDAGLVNNKAHYIDSVTGSGPYVFTLLVATAGKDITAGSDSMAYKYPQQNEALTWSGEFDVPCRFDTDELRAEIVGPGPILRWDGIPIVEIRV